MLHHQGVEYFQQLKTSFPHRQLNDANIHDIIISDEIYMKRAPVSV